jgi:hypothetical protein
MVMWGSSGASEAKPKEPPAAKPAEYLGLCKYCAFIITSSCLRGELQDAEELPDGSYVCCNKKACRNERKETLEAYPDTKDQYFEERRALVEKMIDEDALLAASKGHPNANPNPNRNANSNANPNPYRHP